MFGRFSTAAFAVVIFLAGSIATCPAQAADGGTANDAESEAAGDGASADATTKGDGAAGSDDGAANDGPSGDGFVVACDGELNITVGIGMGMGMGIVDP